VVDVERLTNGLHVLVTALVGTIIPGAITAVTSWWNRDTARAQLEAERLRKLRDDEPPPA
jgi:hypothetical protein